jgi:hypothetical protein
MNGYVSKPIVMEDLFSVIQDVFSEMNRRSDAKDPAVIG